MSKNRNEVAVSPIGTAVFPWITAADTRFDPDGKYQTLLSVPLEEAQSYCAKLDKVLDDFIATLDPQKQAKVVRRSPYEDEYTRPEITGELTDEEKAEIKANHVPEPTGNIEFKYVLKRKVTPRDPSKTPFEQEPIVVHADTGAAVEGNVFGGSIIRIKGALVPYYNAMSREAGLSMRMRAVQVIEQVEGSADGAGFWTDFDE